MTAKEGAPAVLKAESTPAALTSRPDLSVTIKSHQIIAGFLKSQGYSATLDAFKKECGGVCDLDELVQDAPDLREVVEDFLASRVAALSLAAAPRALEAKLEQIELDKPLPSKVIKTIKESTNVLNVTKGVFPSRRWDSDSGRFVSSFKDALFSCSVDRCIKVYSTNGDYSMLGSYALPSPALSITISPSHHSRFLLAGTMEGSLHLIDFVTHKVIQTLKNHNKYIVRVCWSPDGKWVATLGYDRLVKVYEVVYTDSASDDDPILLDGEVPDALSSTPHVELVHRFERQTKSNPEAAIFLPDSSHLVFACREDHLLYYLSLPSFSSRPRTITPPPFHLTTQNLNENGDSWVSFSVLHMSLHPFLPILSLSTSTENSRVLLYPFHSSERLSTLFTTAAQSDYSTPRHTWLKDGSAFAVNSEDGVVRVVDLRGSVRARIGSHGQAAPLEEEEGEGEGEEDSEEARTRRALRRREIERASSVVKDVAIWEKEDGKLVFASCGFDKTVRFLE